MNLPKKHLFYYEFFNKFFEGRQTQIVRRTRTATYVKLFEVCKASAENKSVIICMTKCPGTSTPFGILFVEMAEPTDIP